MYDKIYSFLDRIGYLHPIHPAMTHMPIGLVVGALFFIWIALARRFRFLVPPAYYVLVLAFIFFFPTALMGYMDWQRYFAGAWLFPIEMKLGLATVLGFLLLFGVIYGARRRDHFAVMVPIVTLCFFTVTALGYFGGQLVYGGNAPKGEERYAEGQQVFDNNCTGCHAHGGNIIRPNLPLRNAPELVSFEKFEHFIRGPHLPSGKKGPMPKFPESRIPPANARKLYDYIVNVIAHPKRE